MSDELYVDLTGKEYSINLGPELGNYECHLFGSEPPNAFTYRPPKGKVPNRFQRYMSKIFFGNTWVKTNEGVKSEYRT